MTRPSHYAFSTTWLATLSLLFIIIVLPFLLYLSIITYYYTVIYLLTTFTSITNGRHIMTILYMIPPGVLVSISMIMAYKGYI